MKRDEMPVGFSFALAQNPEAMQKFAMLSEEKRKKSSTVHMLLLQGRKCTSM